MDEIDSMEGMGNGWALSTESIRDAQEWVTHAREAIDLVEKQVACLEVEKMFEFAPQVQSITVRVGACKSSAAETVYDMEVVVHTPDGANWESSGPWDEAN